MGVYYSHALNNASKSYSSNRGCECGEQLRCLYCICEGFRGGRGSSELREEGEEGEKLFFCEFCFGFLSKDSACFQISRSLPLG